MKIASWNVEGRLHGYKKEGRGTAAHILRGIKRLNADVLVLPEFYMDTLADGVRGQLENMGYELLETAYNDQDKSETEREKWGEMHVGVLSRLPVRNVEVIRPGGMRNLLACQVEDPESGRFLRVVATHLDDRTEALRVRQVEDLVRITNQTRMPTVVPGDFNAMWPQGRARLIRAKPTRFLAKHMPVAGLRFVAERVVEMAEGTALSLLAAGTNLRDADPRRRPTTTPKMRYLPYLPSVRLIQIDHMLVSPEVKVNNFAISKDGGSDHRAISANITIDTTTLTMDNKNNQREGK